MSDRIYRIEIFQFVEDSFCEREEWDIYVANSCPFKAAKEAQEKAVKEGLNLNRSFHVSIFSHGIED